MSPAVAASKRFAFCASHFPDDDHRGLAQAVSRGMQRPCWLAAPVSGLPLTYRMDVVMLGTVMVARLTTSAIDVAIGQSAAPDDNIVVEILVDGDGFFAEQASSRVQVERGQAMISMGALPRRNRVERDAVVLILQMPLRNFTPVIGGSSERPLRLLEADTPGLLTLRHYLQSVLEASAIDAPGLLPLMSDQLRDLVLVLMCTAWPGTKRLNGPRAWSTAARQLVARHLAMPELDEHRVARELGISGSYLRKLFANDGGFAAYVRRERLDRARLLLRDPACATLRVIDIAQACGFGDLSTFNRRFRQRFGTAPSAARGASVPEESAVTTPLQVTNPVLPRAPKPPRTGPPNRSIGASGPAVPPPLRTPRSP
jgi:AraC-like DNA-binding protein